MMSTVCFALSLDNESAFTAMASGHASAILDFVSAVFFNAVGAILVAVKASVETSAGVAVLACASYDFVLMGLIADCYN